MFVLCVLHSRTFPALHSKTRIPKPEGQINDQNPLKNEQVLPTPSLCGLHARSRSRTLHSLTRTTRGPTFTSSSQSREDHFNIFHVVRMILKYKKLSVSRLNGESFRLLSGVGLGCVMFRLRSRDALRGSWGRVCR